MEYRINKRTGDKISEMGLGSAWIYEDSHEEGVKALRYAYEEGINFYDLATADAVAFPIFKEALHDVRKELIYQIHFGADYSKGEYGWSYALDDVKRSLDWQLKSLDTDYIDYGFMHCMDEEKDWKAFKENGVLDYMLDLQKQGVVKHIGLSSHTPSLVHTVLDEVDADLLMFSINPAYDYGEGGEYAHGGVSERNEVYRRCEKEGRGISVMKTFAGGTLLDAKQSPFKQALADYQCIKYALDKPGVVTLVAGATTKKDVERLVDYYNQPPEALDYSIISTFAPPEADGKCVYCNHCKPCPQGIDIGSVNKYYDLAKAGDDMAKEHYLALSKNASDCVQCSHCNDRCPFNVDQMARMKEIEAFFD